MFVFKVSVIIAVYNAAEFIIQAVKSALAQPETAEVVLVEDGSTDNSLEVCQALVEKYEKVNLYQHPGGVNKGAPASFNLGIQKSTCEYLAILGADDYFLPERFLKASQIFHSTPMCDGVYEAIGIHFESDAAQKRWKKSKMHNEKLTTITRELSPDELFKFLISGKVGYFSLDGLVFKRSILQKAGYMNEALLLHQDTDFSIRLASIATLLPGKLDEPVAVRRVHDQNRISAPRSNSIIYRDRMMMFRSLHSWFTNNSTQENASWILYSMVTFSMNHRHFNVKKSTLTQSEINRRIRLFLLAFEFPEVLLHKIFWQRFLPLKMRIKFESKYKILT